MSNQHKVHRQDGGEPPLMEATNQTRLPIRFARERKGYHWFVVGTVCIGAFMAALDASIVNIALPTLQRQFDTSISRIAWVSLVYLLTLSMLIVPLGRVADMLGRRWMYALGFSVFIIGSFLCGISSNLTFLLGSRVLQAAGAAMLQANSVAIITASTPARVRGTAIGIQASAQGIGLSLGPAVGGTILSVLSWRWIFLVNVPVGIIGTTLGILLLPADVKSRIKESFDFLGALLLAPVLVGVIYVLNEGVKVGWGSTSFIIIYAVVVLSFMLFLIVEKRIKAPLVDLALFRDRTFSLGNTTGTLSFAIMYAVLLLTPFYLEGVQQVSSFVSGLFLTVVPIGMTVFTPVSGRIADKFGPRLPSVLGLGVSGLGCLLLSFIGGAVSSTFLVIGLFFVGVGIGTFTPPNNSSVMGSAPSNRLGVAGGILNMARSVGTGIGVALGGLTYESFLLIQRGYHGGTGTHIQMLSAFRDAYLTIAVLAVLSAVMAAVPKKTRKQQLPPQSANISH